MRTRERGDRRHQLARGQRQADAGEVRAEVQRVGLLLLEGVRDDRGVFAPQRPLAGEHQFQRRQRAVEESAVTHLFRTVSSSMSLMGLEM